MHRNRFGNCIKAMPALALVLALPLSLTGCKKPADEGTSGVEVTEYEIAGDEEIPTDEEDVASTPETYEEKYMDADGYYLGLFGRFKAIPGYVIPTGDIQTGERPWRLVNEEDAGKAANLTEGGAESFISIGGVPIGDDGIDAAMERLKSDQTGVPYTEGEGYVAKTGIEYRRAYSESEAMFVYEWEGIVMNLTMHGVTDEDAHLFLDTLEPYEDMEATARRLLAEDGEEVLAEDAVADIDYEQYRNADGTYEVPGYWYRYKVPEGFSQAGSDLVKEETGGTPDTFPRIWVDRYYPDTTVDDEVARLKADYGDSTIEVTGKYVAKTGIEYTLVTWHGDMGGDPDTVMAKGAWEGGFGSINFRNVDEADIHEYLDGFEMLHDPEGIIQEYYGDDLEPIE